MSRRYFDTKLTELKDDIAGLGDLVSEELAIALQAVIDQDTAQAQHVFDVDEKINQTRFNIEEKCFTLISTQQPAAGDLRTIFAVMHIVVDLERMGDHAKAIAKIVSFINDLPARKHPAELVEMGEIGQSMLKMALTAYKDGDIKLANKVADMDDEMDDLYAAVFTHFLAKMIKTKKAHKVEGSIELLRMARSLERFGDLATNIAERVIYEATGEFNEMNTDEGPEAAS